MNITADICPRLKLRCLPHGVSLARSSVITSKCWIVNTSLIGDSYTFSADIKTEIGASRIQFKSMYSTQNYLLRNENRRCEIMGAVRSSEHIAAMFILEVE